MNFLKTATAGLLLGLFLTGFVLADTSPSPAVSATPVVTLTPAPANTPTPAASPSPSPTAAPQASVTPVVVASGFSSVAVTPASKPGAWWLAPNAEYWSCFANYDIALANGLQSAYPAASDLAAKTSALQTAETQLQSLATAGDGKAYQDYHKDSFAPAYKDARAAINHDWKLFVTDKSIPQASIDAYKTVIKEAQASREGCLFTVAKDNVNARISYWNYVLGKESDYASNLTAKGVITDASAIQSLISGATPQVITPLQTAVAAATNRSQVWAAERMYCLFNGCKNGLNYHLEASYELAVRTAVFNALSANVSADANLTADADVSAALASGKAGLALTQSLLSTIGTRDYQAGEYQQLRQALKSVNQDITRLRAAIRKVRLQLQRGAQKARQQQQQQERQQRRQRQTEANRGIA